MSEEPARIVDRFPSLSPSERAEPAYAALRTLDDDEESETPADIEQAWEKESGRRIESIRDGTAKLMPAEEFFASRPRAGH